MGKTRTFVAVALSPEVRRRASDLIERLKVCEVRVGWVLPENRHITLKFLGDQSDEEVSLICRAVIEAVKELSPFTFACQGAGAFPDCRRPRTIWLGVGAGAEGLQRVQQRVDQELAEHGYPQERRAYQPHITLGRVRSGGAALQQLGQLIQKTADFVAGSVDVDEVLVMASHLLRAGPQYEVLARAPLGG